ncbi:MAG: TolC family protein [Pseudomonadota bacterium]|nr:TolC family protein [Pseudomonadota bacterium]
MKTLRAFSFVSLLSVGLVLSLPAHALTYSDLLKNILANQPEQATLEGYDALEESASESQNSWFSGNTNLIIAHENDSLTGDLNKQKWQIGAEVPLWLPGQRQSQKNLAVGFGELNINQASLLKLQASALLRELVWQYRQGQVKAEIAKQSVKQAQKLQNLIRVFVNVGEKPKIDALLADKALLAAQSKLLMVENEFTTAQNRYQFWTKMNDLPKPLAERLVEFDLENHPAVKQLNAQLTVLIAEYQNLKATQKDNPVFSFGGFQEDDQGMSPNTSLYAQISYPIGSNPTKKVETVKHKTAVLQKEAEIKRFELELNNQLFAAEQKVSVSKQQLSLVDKETKLAAQTLKLATQAYKAGESNIQTLVNAQQQFLDSKLQQALTQIELTTAIAHRNQIAGVSL